MSRFFGGKVYGVVTVGERGQVVIPSDIRKLFNIKSGDKFIVMARPDRGRKIIGLIAEKEFTQFLNQAEKHISKLKKKVLKKGER